MVGHGIGLEMENMLDLNMPIKMSSMVVVWWCMTAFRPGAWYKIEGRVDRHLYKFILENFLWSNIHDYNLDPSRLVFQQDNDHKHTSKIVQEWLASQSS